MLTYIPQLEKDDRPSYRPYRATVTAVRDVSPGLRRVTFVDESLGGFGTDGLDQRIKIVFPVDGGFGPLDWVGELALSGEWYSRWRELPDAQRVPFRTYTVRAVRPQLGELDVDFVVHEPVATGDGPGIAWIRAAAPGDEVVVVGPDARSVNSADGIDWRPGQATTVLLAGDETAAPAICSILESLPRGIRAQAFIEVESASHAVPITVAADVNLLWIARDAGEARLIDAVADWVAANRDAYAGELSTAPQRVDDPDDLLWETPDAGPGSFYAWLAGEQSAIVALRRLLVKQIGIDRSRVAFMGYWRRGRAEST